MANFADGVIVHSTMSNIISHHIATLLRRHDCVIVPGVGAFVSTYEPSAFSGDLLTPPRRVVTFNPVMVHDDGLLADSVSRRMKISFEQARERVAAEAALIQRRLKAEGAVSLPLVGSLQRLSGGRVEFLPEAMWTLSLPALKAAKAAPVFEVVRPEPAEPQKAVAVVKVPLRLRWLRVAAAAVVLCVLGFALSTPIDLQQAQNASLAAPAFTPPEAPVFEPLEVPENLELNMAMAPADGILSTVKPAPARPKPYVIVVASLASYAKALEYIAYAGEPGLKVMTGNGYFRVYAAEGSTPQEARDAANARAGFDARFPDSWVCRR